MNNKGFAITTILYGIMVLFCLLLVSLLGILSSYRKTQELLIEENNGARTIAKKEIINNNSFNGDEVVEYDGLTYTLTYDGVTNGGKVNGSLNTYNEDYTSGEYVDLDVSCSKTDYTFVGWNTDKNAEDGLSGYKMPNGNITLYCIFKK